MTHTRIALCSDTHFWLGATRRWGANGEQLQPWSEQILLSLLQELRTAAPDLVFHLGDISCGGGSFEMPDTQFVATLDATLKAFRGLPSAFHALPGNHDCPPGSDYSFAEQQLGLLPGQGVTVDLSEVRIVTLNTQGHPLETLATYWPKDPTHGWVSLAELARLEEALATAGDRPVLLLLHQLLQPWAGNQPWYDLYGVANGAEVHSLLARYGNVRAVFQGHAHRLDVRQAMIAETQYCFVVLPAVIEYPLGWLQLDVAPDRIEVAMRRLPLDALAGMSLEEGEDRDWKAGRAEWQQFALSLSKPG